MDSLDRLEQESIKEQVEKVRLTIVITQAPQPSQIRLESSLALLSGSRRQHAGEWDPNACSRCSARLDAYVCPPSK